MMNIEKLAIEIQEQCQNGASVSDLMQILEAFAKALQSSEPFGYFKAEPFGWTDCAETDAGAIALYEHPPKQEGEPVEKYNKLLDALRDQVGANDRAGWLGEIDDMLYSILDDENYVKVSREINRAKAEGLQAIAEAEGK